MGVINMLNAEKYKNEILEKSNVVFDFSISKDRHTIEKCLGVCDNCIFSNMGEHCSNVKVNWLLSEHKEPVKLTKFEYDFLNAFQDKESSYLARDKDGSIFLYLNKPSKEEEIWADYESSLAILDRLFKFVKWQDSEPTSIKDVLNNCEVVNDAEE